MRRLLPLLILATACAPMLHFRVDQTQVYRFSGRCGQGPFTFTARLKGARWAENLAIAGFAPHQVVGKYAIRLDGKPLTQGDFSTQRLVTNGTYTYLQRDDKPANQRCVERPPEVVAQVAPPPELVPVPPPVPPPPPPPGWRSMALPPAPEVAAPPRVPEPPPAAPAIAQWLPAGGDAFVPEGDRNFTLTSFSWVSADEIGTPPVQADAVLEVTLWSQEPNDWEGALFQIVQEVAQPSVPEAEYIAWLHKQKREAEADARKRQAEADAAYQQRLAHCNAHHEDEDCWGPGGYDARFKAINTPQLPTPPAPPPQKPVEVVVPQPRAPDGPPPTAQTEMPPPQPSTHAEWVAGYWKWTGFAWSWLGGWWKVPQLDLVAQATTIAPSAPPPVRIDMPPPPPIVGAVWLAGAWYWDGRLWLWHPGQWTLPPRQGLYWQPPTWISVGRGVRLVPGVWGEVMALPPR